MRPTARQIRTAAVSTLLLLMAAPIARPATPPARAAVVATPRILAYPCLLAAACTQRALYKPRLFTPGSHYTIERAHWTEWGRFGASASVTLFSEFQGRRRSVRTTVVFSTPRRMCGVLTFTQWHSGSGDGGVLTKTGKSCFFVVS
jgi:hypothetical protein